MKAERNDVPMLASLLLAPRSQGFRVSIGGHEFLVSFNVEQEKEQFSKEENADGPRDITLPGARRGPALRPGPGRRWRQGAAPSAGCSRQRLIQRNSGRQPPAGADRCGRVGVHPFLTDPALQRP